MVSVRGWLALQSAFSQQGVVKSVFPDERAVSGTRTQQFKKEWKEEFCAKSIKADLKAGDHGA